MRKRIKQTAAALTALVLAASLLGSAALTAAAEEVPPGPAPTEPVEVSEVAQAPEVPEVSPPAEEPPAEMTEVPETAAPPEDEPAAEATEPTTPPEPAPEQSAPPEPTAQPSAPEQSELPDLPKATEPTPSTEPMTATEAPAAVTPQPSPAAPPTEPIVPATPLQQADASQSAAAQTAAPAEAPISTQMPATPETATPETAAPPTPTATPAPTQQSLTAALFSDIDCTKPLSDGTVITLEGLLPTGGSARAVPVQAALADEEQAVLAAYDITVLDAAGTEWQPEEGIRVGITSPALTEAVQAAEQADTQTAEQAAPAAQTIDIYHIDGGSTPATVEGGSAGASIVASDVAVPEGEKVVSFTAEGFSVYLFAMRRPARYALRVANETTGSMGDTTLGFAFTVTVNGRVAERFTLIHGQSATLKLCTGDKVTVTQAASTANNAGYTTSVSDGSGVLVGNSYGYTVTSCSRDMTLTFTNNRELSPPTGLSADAAPYAAMLGLCTAAVLGMGRGRKKMRR